HTIGAFHGRPHRTTRASTHAQDVPPDARDWRLEGDTFLWAEGERQAWPGMAHHEWSAAICARRRPRLLSGPTGAKGVWAGVLHVDPAQLVTCRTDAIYLTSDPGWPDDGSVGRFRRKRLVEGPLRVPTNQTELLRLREAS